MIPPFWSLLLSTALFALGIWGVVRRRHALIVAMSAQVMSLGAILLLATGAQVHGVDGRVLALLAVGLAAAQAVVALCLVARCPLPRTGTDLDSGRQEM